MVKPSTSANGGKIGISFVFIGILLIAGGVGPFAMSVADGAYNYEISLSPTTEESIDVDSESLPDVEREALSNAVHPESTTVAMSETQSSLDHPDFVDESEADATLDSRPTGFENGDVIRVSDMPSPSEPELTASNTGAEWTDQYVISVTKNPEPVRDEWLLSFSIGLFVLSLGLKRRQE